MSAYLTLVKENVDIISLSRNNDVAAEILENYSITFDGETRIKDLGLAISSINERINRMEKLIAASLIKREFDEQDYVSNQEYLVELYEIRAQLYFINSILYEAYLYEKDIYFTYG